MARCRLRSVALWLVLLCVATTARAQDTIRLALTARTGGALQVAWSVDSYETIDIFNVSLNGSLVAQVPADVTTYAFHGLTNSTVYAIRVEGDVIQEGDAGAGSAMGGNSTNSSRLVSNELVVATLHATSPAAPPMPSLVSVGGGYFRVRVSLPLDTGGVAITGISIMVRSLTDGTTMSLSHTVHEPEFEVFGLTAKTEYRVLAYVTNAEDLNSFQSPALFVDTLAVQLPGPCSPPTVLSVTGGSIQLQLNPPVDDGGARVMGYIVFLAENGTSNFLEVANTVMTAQPNMVDIRRLPGPSKHPLLPLTTYNVKAVAVNMIGICIDPTSISNVTGDAISITTAAASLPEAPPAPYFLSATGGQVSIQLLMPGNMRGSTLLGFSIRVDGAMSESVNSSQECPYSIGYLQANTNYSVQVAVTTDIGTSDWSPVLVVSTGNASRPSAPLDASVTGVTSSQALVRWSTPIDSGGLSITEYRLTIISIWGRTIVSAPGSILSYRLSRLIADTAYTAKITAVNEILLESPSSKIRGVTFETLSPTLPSIPSGVRAVSSTGGAIEVGWQAAEESGGSSPNGLIYNVSMFRVAPCFSGLSTTRPCELCDLVRLPSSGDQYVFYRNCTQPSTASCPDGSMSCCISTSSSPVGSGFLCSRIASQDRNRLVVEDAPATVFQMLNYSTTYYFAVQAINRVGKSAYSPVVGLRTSSQTAPGYPSNIRQIGGTGGSTALSWDPPHDTGGTAIIGYNVYRDYQLLTPQPIIPPFVDCGGGIVANTQYMYSIAAINAFRLEGKVASVLVVTPPVSMPQQIASLSLLGRSISWLNVSISTGCDQGGSSALRYQFMVAHDGAFLTSGLFPCCSFILPGLLADTVYQVSVRVANEVATLDWVNASFATTSGIPATTSMVLQRPNTYSLLLSPQSVPNPDREILAYDIAAYKGSIQVQGYTFPCDSVIGPGLRACPDLLRVDGLSPSTTYQVLSRAIGPRNASDWNSQDFTTSNESRGVISFESQIYVASCGSSTNITLRRRNGTGGTRSVVFDVAQSNVVVNCSCVLEQGCSCQLQLAKIGAASRPANVTFVDGQEIQTVIISLWDDDPSTTQATFVVMGLMGESGAVGSQSQTVLQVNPSVRRGFPSFTRSEADVLENSSYAIVHIRRLNGSSGVLTFGVETFDISSTAFQHYMPLSQTIRMADRQSLTTVWVRLLDNRYYEGTRSFGVRISQRGIGLPLLQSVSTRRIHIIDDEDPTMLLPGQPNAVDATRVTGGEIELSWRGSNITSGVPNGHVIRVSTPSNGSDVYGVYNTSSNTSFILSSLQPRTLYRFQVAAWNAYGMSNFSDTALILTTGPSQPSAPLNLRASTTGGSYIELVWNAPRDLGGASVIGYQLSMLREDGILQPLTSLESQQRAYVVRGLNATTAYTFSVATSTTAFQGTVLANLTIATGAAAAPAKPPPPQLLLPPTGGTLSFAILEPSDLGGVPITDYSLYLREVIMSDDPPLTNSTNATAEEPFQIVCSALTPWANASTRSCTVYKLLAGTKYEAYVVLKNTVGSSEASDRVQYQTLVTIGLPSPPANFRASRVTAGNIYLEWDHPQDLGGAEDVIGYTVFQKTTPYYDDSYFVVYDGKDSTERQVAIKGLTRGSTYAFAVIAQNLASYCAKLAAQQMSEFLTVVTSSTSPLTAPQSLVLVSATGGSITIGWKQPDDLAGTWLQGYFVDLVVNETTMELQRITPTMLGGGTTQFTHYGLMEQTVYRYIVTGVNQDGPGEPSTIANFSTSPCTRAEGVSNGQTINVTGGLITISWDPPLDTGGRPIAYYEVTREGQQSKIVNTTSFTDKNGLIAQEMYLFHVRAFNGLYLGNPGAIWATTGMPSLSDPPIPTETELFGGRVEVEWTNAEDTGGMSILAYEISLFDKDNSTQLGYYYGSETNCAFSSLSANTEYLLRLVAVNPVGRGPMIEYPVSTSDVDLPSPPPAPTANNVLGSSMWLTVYPPGYTGGEEVNLLLHNGTNVVRTIPPGENQTFVSGLVARTVYRFRVVANNSRGQTMGVDLIVSTTDVSQPSAVQSVHLVDSSFDQLSIDWPAVEDTGGDLSLQYEITYFVSDESGSADAPTTSILTATTSLSRITLTNLIPSTAYSISVRPLTSTGIYGEPSPTVHFTTQQPWKGQILMHEPDLFVRESSSLVSIPLIRVNGSFGDLSYAYHLYDGSAISGVNFYALQNVEVMASGVKNGAIDVALINDDVYNPNITFTVEMRDITSNISTETRITILDDGDAGYISFAAPQYRVLENSGAATLPITRTGGRSPTAIIEPYAMSASTALATRFTIMETAITFNEGDSIHNLTVIIQDDDAFQYWPDTVVIGFRILQGGVWVGDIESANLTAVDNGDVSPPKEITGLTSTNATGGSMQLTWTPPEDRGAATAELTYLVQFVTDGVGALNQTVISSSPTIYGLTALTTYQVSVSAVNNAGAGVASKPLLLSTTRATPPMEPRDVNLVVSGSSMLMLSWTAPLDDGGSPIIGYVVYNVLSNGSMSEFPLVLCSQPTLCSVNGLLALTTYTIRVRANTAALPGTGRFSLASQFSTSNPTVPDPPPLANVTWVSAGAMTIAMFNPLNDGGTKVQTYRLYIRGPSDASFIFKYEGTLSSYTVYRLERLTSYEIKYQVTNNVGVSDFGPVLTFQTLERSLVSAPLNLTVVSASGGAITLRWAEPLDVGGRPVTGYTVMIKGPWMNASVIGYDGQGVDATTGVVYGLSANTTYSMYVRAYTEVSFCFSPTVWAASVPILASTTRATLPTPAPSLFLVRVTGGIVELTWTSPKDTGGVPIIGYTLSLVSPTGTVPILSSPGTGPFSFIHNNLIESTVYTYLVKANSSVGESPLSDQLVVKTMIATAPSAPLNVRQLQYVTGGAIEIGWDRPIDTGGQSLQGYWVYRDGMAVTQSLNASVRSFVDKLDLHAASYYVYTVRAVSWSTMGSELSTPLTATTANATIPQPPRVVSNMTGASYIDVQWAADPDTGGIAVSLFEAKLLRGAQTVGVYTGINTTFRFTRLVADTTYNFVLIVRNQLGPSSPSSLSFTTFSAVVPDRPPAPIAVLIFGSNITLEVKVPDEVGGANVTEMRLYEAGLGLLGKVTLTPGSLNCNFTVVGLSKLTEYSITASAVNRLGEGPRGPALVVRTGPLSPPGVILTAPNVTLVTGTTLGVVWSAPVDSGGDLSLQYEIRFVANSTNTVVTQLSVNRSLVGTSLTYGTGYSISVRAFNDAGKGGWSPNVSTSTLPDSSGEFNMDVPSVRVLENVGVVDLNISRSRGFTGAVDIAYSVQIISFATAGKDFALLDSVSNTSGIVTFASHQVSAYIKIRIRDDDVYENAVKQFTVQLTTATLAGPSQVLRPRLGINNSTSVAILDDGDAGYVSFSQTNYSVREDAVYIDVPIVREGGKSSQIVLGFTFTDGTATIDRDYRRPLVTTLTMENEQTSAVLRVSIMNDRIYESPDEFFTISMASVSGGALFRRNATTITILDDGDESVPAIPPPPVLLASTGGAVRLAQSLPAHNGSAKASLFNFVIRVAEAVTGVVLFNTSRPIVSELSVGRLVARRSYNVSVAANNSIGVGPFSPGVIVTTTGPTLPGPVMDINEAGKTGGSILLSWSPPDDTGGVPVTKYRVYRIVAESSPVLVAEFLRSDPIGMINGLTTATTYQFAVQAGNGVLIPEIANGWGALGMPRNFTTAPVTLPGPTRLLTVGPANATGGSITVSWSPPFDTGGAPILGYDIYVKNTSTSFFKAAQVPKSTILSVVIEELYASNSYSIFALAVSTLHSISLPGSATVMSGSRTLITTQDLSKSVIPGTVLLVGSQTLVVGNMTTATKGTLPLSDVFVGKSAAKQAVSAIGNATAFMNSSTTPAAIPQIPPPATLVNTTGGAIAFRIDSPGDTGGIPIESFKVLINGSEPKEEEVMKEWIRVTHLKKTLVMRVTNLKPHTEINVTAIAMNSISLCDFSKNKSSSLPAVFQTQNVSRPEPPQIALLFVTGGGMKLSLVDPFDTGGAPINRYLLYMSTGQAKDDWQLVSTIQRPAQETKRLSTVVARLKPTTKYAFQMSVNNGAFESKNSSPVSFTTSGISPPGPCDEPSLAAASGGMLNVSWEDPPDNGGAAVTDFTVTLQAANTSVSTGMQVVRFWKARTYAFYGLSAETKYSISVRAQNEKGISSEGTTATFSTTKGTPPNGPIQVTMVGSTGGAAVIVFNEPLDMGGTAREDMKYRVIVDNDNTLTLTYSDLVASRNSSPASSGTDGGSRTGRRLAAVSPTGVVIGGLDPLSLYSVQIQPLNTFASGNVSGATPAATTEATLPSAPRDLVVNSTSGGSVELTWTAPADTGGLPLLDYVVYMATAATGPFTEQCRDSGTRCRVGSLSPSTSYWFVAEANTALGRSQYSSTITATTLPLSKPSVPGKIFIVAVKEDTIICNWTSPLDTGGSAITSYTITVNDETNRVLAKTVLQSPTTSATISGLTAATQYSLSVTATNQLTTSTPSALQFVTTATMANAPPDPAISCVSSTSVGLVWYPHPDATRYQLTRDNIEVYTGAITSFVDTTVSSNVRYEYKLVAEIGGAWARVQSSPAVVTTLTSASTEGSCTGRRGFVRETHYRAGTTRSWLIQPSNAFITLTLQFTRFDLECDHDFVRIETAQDKTLLWQGGCTRGGFFIVQSPSAVRVQLTTDASVERQGFELYYETDRYPVGDVPTRIAPPQSTNGAICSGRGVRQNDGTCKCSVGFTGEGCNNHIVCCSNPMRCTHSICARDPRRVIVVSNEFGDDVHGTGAMMNASERGSASKAVKSLSKGLSLARDGDTVFVYPGVYKGASNRDLEISSLRNVTIATLKGYAWTTLDCERAGRGMVVTASSVVIDGLKITNGLTTSDGGSIKMMDANLTLNDSFITASRATRDGGAIAATRSVLSIRGVAIDSGRAIRGGGIALVDSQLELVQSNITFCASDNGGALTLLGSSRVAGASDAFVSNNTASGDGGAILIVSGSATIKNISIFQNVATRGGGWAAWDTSDVIMDTCAVAQNEALVDGGGGALFGSTTFRGSNTDVTDNIAAVRGGGLFIEGARVTAAFVASTGWARIAENRAVHGAGIAVTSCHLTLSGINITNNSASETGGGLGVVDTVLELKRAGLTLNRASLNGGGVHAISSSITAGDFIVVANNQAVVNGSGLYIRDGNASGNISLARNNASERGGGIYAEGSVNLANVTIKACSAREGGGGYFAGSSATIDRAQLFDCTASLLGGGLALASSTLKVVSSAIQRCSSVLGGSVHIRGRSELSGTMVIRDSTASEMGGAVYGTETLRLFHVLIQNSTAKRGGGVFIENADVTATNLTITSCNSSLEGGAWSANASTVALKDVRLTKHKSGTVGGGMALLNTTVGHDNVVVSNSEAVMHGGGLAVINSTFAPASTNIAAVGLISNNTAQELGGNVYVEGTSVVASVHISQGRSKQFGGGIAIARANVMLRDSLITQNQASEDGGGISVQNGSICEFVDAVVSGNNATISGGGASVDDSEVHHGGVSFLANIAPKGGSFVFKGTAKLVPVSTERLLLNANYILDLSSSKGTGTAMYLTEQSIVVAAGLDISGSDAERGAVFVDAATLELRDCEFVDNKAIEGAALYANAKSDVVIVGTTFRRNSATLAGGSVMFEGDASGRAFGRMIDCALTDNRAVQSGGAIAISYANVSLTNTTLDTNRIEADDGGGGAIAAIVSGTLNATNCIFSNNAVGSDKAKGTTLYLLKSTSAHIERSTITSDLDARPLAREGGVVYLSDKDSKLTVIDSNIEYSVSRLGGAFYVASATLEMVNTTVHDAYGLDFGGSIYIDSGILGLTNCTIRDCFAFYDGGAVYSKGPTRLTVDGTTFAGNLVQDSGGALFLAPGGGAQAMISNSTFARNGNRGSGSAIAISRKNKLMLMDSVVEENGDTDTEGGALYAVDAQVVVRDSVFRKNTANRGGAIELSRDATLTLTNSSVVENHAILWGGALYMAVRAVATIVNSTVEGNSAATGGAIYLLGSTNLTVYETSFKQNHALSFGGAVTLVGHAWARISNGAFDANTAYTGGALSATEHGNIILTAVGFTNNSASDFGGALYVDTQTRTGESAIQLRHLDAGDNLARAGRDIYWVYHPSYVLACESCRSATSVSGAFRIASSPVEITAGWWPTSVTSGVSLATKKIDWIDPLAPPQAPPSGTNASAGDGSQLGTVLPSTLVAPSGTPPQRRLEAFNFSSDMDPEKARAITNPNQSSPFVGSLAPTIVVRDYYGAIADQDNQTHCLARKLSTEIARFDFRPADAVFISHGYVTFDDAQVLADPRERPFELLINCTLADDLERNLSVVIQVDNCNPGFEAAGGRCIPCKPNLYSLDGVKCHACPLGATCEDVDDQTQSSVGVGLPARAQGYFLHDSRETYLESNCNDLSSWDDLDPCKQVEGVADISRRLQNCSTHVNFTHYWPSRRVFACLTHLEYYTCDTRDACVPEQRKDIRHVETVQELSQRAQCDHRYGSVMCATCQKDFYKVSNGTCFPCSDPDDPNVAKMVRLLAMVPLVFAIVAAILVWYYFSNSTESEIMKQARAARKFQIYDPNAQPRSVLLRTSVFIKQRIADMMRRARRTIVVRRARPHLFRIAPREVGIPPFRAEKFKILLGFFQIFGGFKKVYEIPWPDEMSRLMDIFTIADFSLVDTTGIECFIKKDYFYNYQYSLAAVVLLLTLTTLLLSWGVVRYRVKLSGLPRHCVNCGLPVFQMLKRQPKTLERRATIVSMLRIQQKEHDMRMKRRSFVTRAKDSMSTQLESSITRTKSWWSRTRAGQAFERFLAFVRLPASSSRHYPACPTTQRITSEVLMMVVRSNLRLWRSRVRLRLNYQSFQNKCIKLFFWIMLLFYPELSQRVIGMFYCDEIGHQHFMSRDKSHLCYEGVWLYYLPLTMFLIAVWVIGVPLLFWTIVFLKRRSGIADKMLLLEDPSHVQLKQRLLGEMHRDLVDRGMHVEPEKLHNFEKEMMVEFLRNKRLNEPSMVAQVGFIYHSYRTEFWWFEVWDLLRKLFLNCIIGLLAKTGANRIIAGLIVFLVYLSVLLFYQPFKEQSDSTLAGVTQIQLFITLFCGLMLKMGALHMQDGVIMLLTYTAFITNVLTMTFAVFSIVYERVDAARKERRRVREDHRRAIQTHVRKLWLRAYGWALTELYLRDDSIRPMPYRVILELARRDRDEKKLQEMDLQLARSLHADDDMEQDEAYLSASQIELDLPRPGSLDTPPRLSSDAQKQREASTVKLPGPDEMDAAVAETVEEDNQRQDASQE